MFATANPTPAIELTRVSRVYGAFAALRNVSLTIPAGASVVVLGENGAGKSTLLRLIAGLTSPTHGSLEIFGEPPRDQSHRIAYMSHETMLYDELTGLENLRYFAALQPSGLTPEAALREVGLDPALPRRVGEYSQGMKQRASLARVLLTQPDILLLDEPFSNLDVASAAHMVELLLHYVQTPSSTGQNRTLLLTTHQAELARPLARTTLTLRAGEVISEAAQ
ncbi:MAG TPA: ABC transporter ATP-binding protein [Acidobacteriaceae bacterium]